jgi:hypothetical protein
VLASCPERCRTAAAPFQYRTLLQVSAALGVPYAYVSNDMLKANYSKSRLALLEFRRRVEAYQHAVIVWQLCRQVWARWMDTAVFAGALDLPDYDRRRRDYLACDWLPSKWDWIDLRRYRNGLRHACRIGVSKDTTTIAVLEEFAMATAAMPRWELRKSQAAAQTTVPPGVLVPRPTYPFESVLRGFPKLI